MALTLTNNSATIGTSEHSLPANTTTAVPTAQTDDCFLEVELYFTSIAVADEFQVRLYEKANTSTQGTEWTAYVTGANPGPHRYVVGIVGDGWDFTVKKLAGTDRTVHWSLRKVT